VSWSLSATSVEQDKGKEAVLSAAERSLDTQPFDSWDDDITGADRDSCRSG
jgi:hypothetical protein